MTKIISLNVNGARLGHKRKWVKDLVRQNKVQFLCIQETKSNRLNDFDVNALWGRNNKNWVASPSTGISGGIISIWDTEAVDIEDTEVDRHVVIAKGN